MADLIVSRIQNRRGRQVDLPQPLRPGEYGWAMDTGLLFIGGDADLTPSGVQIISGFYTTAQSMINNQMIEVDMSALGSFDLADFRLFMGDAANFPTVSGNIGAPATPVAPENVLYDEEDKIAFIGLNLTQSPEQANYITDIANAVGTYADAVPSTLAYTITTNGTFNTNTHGIANSISAILNNLNGTVAIATTRLNIEVLTEFSAADADELFLPSIYTLPASGTFVDFPGAGGLQYDVSEADTLHLEYSCYGNDGSNYLHMTGAMKISSIVASAETTMMDDFIESRDPDVLAGTIEFQSVFVGPNTTKLQYKHNLPMSLTFSTITRRWLSF